MISFSHLGQSNEMRDIVSARAIQTGGEDTFSTRRVPPREAYELGSDSGPNYVWRLLQEDRNLARMRIPYKEIKLRAMLSKSQTREIRLGEYRNQQVVVKRLLKTKRSHIFHVQEFIYQIQIRSTLAHPNIVTLVGVAWSSVADVMLVMEHYPLGDLLTYLQNYGDYTSWERGKYRLAIGIARALVYLHSQPTPVAHRDLRASYVLLTETMRPKLTGFDSPYTAKSDIYAFGVLLTELDTASAPFHDAVSPVGTKLKPIQILNEVMQGTMILIEDQPLLNCFASSKRSMFPSEKTFINANTCTTL
ncbi:hypothetical protein JG688_00016926 [Phytophthora aleatoria]|uniref:Protein kinase domain-containing protein n=1 Tax=Phytophthora aleatoria TaxID=2496075 RepID=A0A8J5ITC4_9STRA|nr:hypothetical protein JG688_00016926 [Phytophthora aleatoria]